MDFPPQFHGLVDALWATYQPTILLWFGAMFGIVLLFGTGIMIWFVLRNVLGR